MNTEEREISLIDLLIYMAKGWKAIVVWMVVMAIALGAFQYARDVKAAKALESAQLVTEEQQLEQAKLTVEQLLQEMPSQEVVAVDKTIDLEQDYALQHDYVQSSILMTMDPYNVSIARLQYWVDTNYTVDYAGVTQKDVTGDIVRAYLNRIEDDSWKETILQRIETETEAKYLNEMIDVGAESSSFTVVVKFVDEEQLAVIVDVLDAELNHYHDELKNVFGNHSLNLINKTMELAVDNDVYNVQQTRKKQLLDLENSILNYKKAFNDNQNKLYDGKVLLNQQVAGGEIDSETEEEIVPQPDAASAPGISLKYLLLGAILGAFLVCMVRAMVYILSNKLKIEDNVNCYFGITNLGMICDTGVKGRGIISKLDAWLDNLSKRNMGNLTKQQQLNMAVSNIALLCEKNDMKKIYLNSSVNCIEDKAGDLAVMLRERGIEVKSGFSILQDASAMEAMNQTDGVVFVEQIGKSCYENLGREVNLCKEHGKSVIGVVVLA